MALRHKCRLPNGISIKPDGINELDICQYETKEIHRNVDVEVLQCPLCGNIELIWHRKAETEDEIYGELEEVE